MKLLETLVVSFFVRLISGLGEESPLVGFPGSRRWEGGGL